MIKKSLSHLLPIELLESWLAGELACVDRQGEHATEAANLSVYSCMGCLLLQPVNLVGFHSIGGYVQGPIQSKKPSKMVYMV